MTLRHSSDLRAACAAALLMAAPACGGPDPVPVPDRAAIARESGLAEGVGVEHVATNCLACHSVRLVVQNRGNADDWRETIRWLQKTQGLWDLDPEEEAMIVSYLSTHYPREQRFARRPPLADDLLPPPRDRRQAEPRP